MKNLTIGIHHSLVNAEILLTDCTDGIAQSITRGRCYLILNWHDYLMMLNETDMILIKLSTDQTEQVLTEFQRIPPRQNNNRTSNRQMMASRSFEPRGLGIRLHRNYCLGVYAVLQANTGKSNQSSGSYQTFTGISITVIENNVSV